MSTRKKVYIIFGVKFGEDFTHKYFDKKYMGKDLYDVFEWDKDKPKDKPFFISDGMNGLYTFFGFIQELNNGQYDFEEEITEISFDFNYSEIINEFKKLFPEDTVNESDIKTYYLPHWV